MTSVARNTFNNKFRETDTHVYFHGGLLSNWHIGKRFSVHLPVIIEDADGRRISKSKETFELNCGEMGMMAAKANLFGDITRRNLILNASSPKDQKAYGKQVTPYDDEVWSKVRKTIVTINTFARLAADEEVRDYLLSTDSKRLVEGSPYDTIWGVGLSYDNPLIDDERNWRGSNLLGDSHEDVRFLLREYGADADPWASVSALNRMRAATGPTP